MNLEMSCLGPASSSTCSVALSGPLEAPRTSLPASGWGTGPQTLGDGNGGGWVGVGGKMLGGTKFPLGGRDNFY